MGHGFKNDSEARALWGSAYEAIPKSVFAVACWHLADCSSDGDAVQRMLEEVGALGMNGCITGQQAIGALKALAALQEGGAA